MSTHPFPVQDSSCPFQNVFTPDLKDGSAERVHLGGKVAEENIYRLERVGIDRNENPDAAKF